MAEIKHSERYGPYMTANNAPVPFEANSSQNSFAAFRAFSENLEDDISFSDLATGKEQYASIKLDKAIRIWGFKIYCRTSIGNKDSGQVPYSFKMQGSNDATTWDDIYTNASASPDLIAQWDAGISKYSWSTPQMIEVNSSGEYLYYRILCAECQTILRGAVTAINANTVKLTLLDLFQVEGVASEVERVELDKTAITVYRTRTETITATVYPEDATIISLVWTSSNNSIASVSGGVVTGVSKGAATITATSNNGITATCVVTVKEILIESITIEPAEVTIENGREAWPNYETFAPKITILPENHTEELYYNEDNGSIAYWDDTNTLIVVRENGNTTLSVRPYDRRSPVGSILVHVVPMLCQSIESTDGNVVIQIGATKKLNFTVLPEAAYDVAYTLTSGNTAVATINGSAVVGVGAGRVTITATTRDKNATTTLEIEVVEEPKYRLSDLLNSTSGMECLRNNVGNDSGTDTVTGVNWFTFNGVKAEKIYVNGDSYIGFGVYGGAQLKVCSRDGKTFYLYRQEGLLPSGIRFLKIRYEGFTRYSSAATEYAIKYELFLFSNNDMFLNVIQTPTLQDYIGASTLTVGAFVHTLDIPINSTPAITFLNRPGVSGDYSVEYKVYPADEVESIALNATETNIVSGKSYQLNAAISPLASNKNVTWASGDNNIATVDNGLVTGVTPGIVAISATTVNDLRATCAVTVITQPPESITLDKPVMQIYTGDTGQLTATVLPTGADKTLKWDASNEAATVSDGVVTAVHDGYVTISATTVNGLSASCAVTTIDKIDISLNKSDLNLQVTETERLVAVVKPDDANKTVTWTSSNTSIVTVLDGLVTAVKKGVATITATNIQGHKATCNVVVRDVGDVSNSYVDAIANNRRGMWDAVVTVGGTNVIPREKIGKITLHEVLFQDSKIGIGAVASSYVEIEFRKTTMKLSNRTLTFKIGMAIGDTVEYIQFGKFFVTDVEGNEDDETRTVTAFDSIKKVSKKYKTELTYPSTAKKVVEEIAEKCGLSFAEGTAFPDVAIPKKIKAKTCRDVLKTLTQLTGSNLVANRASKLEFRWLTEKGITISAEKRYYDFKKADMDSYVRTVRCTNANGEFEATWFGADDNKMDIIFTNPYVDQEIVDMILLKNSLTYRPGELSFLGDPSIQVGDILKVVDTKGMAYTYPVMENTIEYDGGVKNTVVAYAETEEAQEFVAENKPVDERIDEVEENANNRIDNVETTTNGRLDPIETTTNDINDFISGTGGGGFSGALDNTINNAMEGYTGGLKAVSVKEPPASPDNNTIYLIQEEAKTT